MVPWRMRWKKKVRGKKSYFLLWYNINSGTIISCCRVFHRKLYVKSNLWFLRVTKKWPNICVAVFVFYKYNSCIFWHSYHLVLIHHFVFVDILCTICVSFIHLYAFSTKHAHAHTHMLIHLAMFKTKIEVFGSENKRKIHIFRNVWRNTRPLHTHAAEEFLIKAFSAKLYQFWSER
jgi:DNA integrity scanning protein DisA with diadenylate cyclase activity